jgi:hypothetical protein
LVGSREIAGELAKAVYGLSSPSGNNGSRWSTCRRFDALVQGAADFVVTQDRGLHDRARKHSPELGRRVLFVADAVQLLRTTYEPIEAPVRYVEEMAVIEIPLGDSIFDGLRELSRLQRMRLPVSIHYS